MLNQPSGSLFDELLKLTVDALDDSNDMHRQREQYIEEIFRFGAKPFADRIEKYGYTERGDKVQVYPWFREYLEIIGDFRIPYTITTGCAQTGKMAPLDTKILTPTGWILMRDVQVGDWVMSVDGTKCQVLGVYPQGLQDIYEVTLDDGTSTKCGAEHLWYTQTSQDRNTRYEGHDNGLQRNGSRQRTWELTEYGDRPGTVKTTREIMDSLWVEKAGGSIRANHSLPCPKPFQFEQSDSLPVDPYVLGVLLSKSIPELYKFASLNDRLELLQGLMDTDGTIDTRGDISYTTMSKPLIEDIRELVWSLGGVCSKVREHHTKETRLSYTLQFRLRNNLIPFKLKRKASRCFSRNIKNHRRYIYDVKHVGKEECQCIMIDHPSHLYITDNYIPTHNTLGHNLLLADVLVTGKLDTGFFFATRDSRELNVPQQQRPVAERYSEAIEKDTGTQIRQRSDRKLASKYQVGGVTANFSYLSTSAGSQNKSTLAAAGGAAVSFTANVVFVEEASQTGREAKEIVMPRLLASKIPTKPRRDLGTPGGGSGIEADMSDCTHEFYPHYHCPHCRKHLPLHPIGCLLRTIKRKNKSGKTIETAFTESGRPVLWWRHDEGDQIRSAFIACSECGGELPEKTRLNARYKCLRTKLWLREYLQSLPVDDPGACANLRHKVGIHISPLTRKTLGNLAADLIDRGLRASKPADWQQQQLGIPSEIAVTGVTIEMLKKALAAPKPDGSPDFVLCGMDMGRAHDFLTIAEFYLPEDYLSLDQVELSRKTIRRIVFSSEVTREKAKDIISQHKTTYGICDNEPGRDSVMTFCNDVGADGITRLEMADQKDTLKDAVKLDKVKDGGAEYPCWFVRNQKFQDLIFENFVEMAEDGSCLYRLPEVWNKHLTSKSDLSPFKHLTSPTRDPETDRWVRAADGNDDLFYSFLFLEVAFYIYCENMLKYPVWIGEI